MNRVDRLLALILFLQSRRVVTAEQMAEHFELSVRTIYRDLAALGQAGVPIMAEAGVGYRLMRGYHLPPVNFTPEEASALVTAGLLVEKFADPALKEQMQSALLKVRAILPREYQERVARLERGLATTANRKALAQADLSSLQQALGELRVVRFSYRGAGKTAATKREVEPCGLIHYLERWHLIAWCRACADYRDFCPDRMSDLTVLRETFTPREDFNVNQYIRAMPRPTLRAKVKFTELAADRAKREWWLGVIDESRTADGIVLTLATVEWGDLVRWLLSFGSDVTILSPDTVRKSLITAAENAAAHHTRKSKGRVDS